MKFPSQFTISPWGARKKQGNPPHTLQHLGLTLPQLTPQGPGTWKVSADTVVLFDVRGFDFVYPCLVLRLTPGLFGSPGRRMVHHRHHLVSLNLYSSPFGNCWWILLIILTTSNVASHSRREYHMRTTPAADKWRIHSDFTLCPRSVRSNESRSSSCHFLCLPVFLLANLFPVNSRLIVKRVNNTGMIKTTSYARESAAGWHKRR